MPLTNWKNAVKSRTGHRKRAAKPGLDENDSIYGTSSSDTPKARPKPRPHKSKSTTLQDASNLDDETEGAAIALMALQQPQLPKADHDVESMSTLGSEVDELGSSDAEEEIDELDDTDSSSSDSECRFIFSVEFHIC